MLSVLCITLLSITNLAISLEPQDLIDDLIKGNYHKNPENKALELFKVDETFFADLKKEVIQIVQSESPSQVNKAGHVTRWTRPVGNAFQFSLLNQTGRFDDFSTDQIKSRGNKKFHHKKTYPKLAEFISKFPGMTNLRINILDTNSRLSQHEEDISLYHDTTGKPALRTRFHLPIITNPRALMFLEGDLYHFNAGKIYFFHNGCIHAAENNNSTYARIHLIWDMLLTDDTFTRMFQQSTPVNFLNPVEDQKVRPVGQVPIDPNYAKQRKNKPYNIMRHAQLCPMI